jgi:hypothetical protein
VSEKLTLPQNVMLCDRQRAQSLIRDFHPHIDQVGTLKRGDWIRCLIEWQERGEVRCEFISCIVSAVFQANGLLKCRVLQNPEYSANHSLKYGDDLTLSLRHIMVHDPMPTTAFDAKGNAYPLTPEQLEHNVSTLLGGPIAPVAPVPGKQYWTRNGSVANVWTILQDTNGSYFIGEAGGVRDIQWTPEGKHRQGNADLDIVKDPSASELVGA